MSDLRSAGTLLPKLCSRSSIPYISSQPHRSLNGSSRCDCRSNVKVEDWFATWVVWSGIVVDDISDLLLLARNFSLDKPVVPVKWGFRSESTRVYPPHNLDHSSLGRHLLRPPHKPQQTRLRNTIEVCSCLMIRTGHRSLLSSLTHLPTLLQASTESTLPFHDFGPCAL